VENPQKRSNLEGHSEFTTTGVLVTWNNMLHLCDTHMTKAKLLPEKDTKSQATHSIRASPHHPVQKDIKSRGK
jgi:hypothetical protein